MSQALGVFSSPDYDDHEEVVYVRDKDAGLKAIIAVHSTVRGPALGGCRMYPYKDETAAIKDVLRLSRSMTYKAAIAGVRLGGGKSVMIGNPHTEKTPALMRAMGRAVDRLQARYIIGEDIGTNPDDMRMIGEETRAVSCRNPEDGGYGDPAPMTALGTFQAIRAGLKHKRGTGDLNGLTVAVQGVGNVGRHLCDLLSEAGARLVVCDVHAPNAQVAVEKWGAQVVATEEIHAVEADVFAPCAVGGTLNARTIPALNCGIVAGAANNQLAAPMDAGRLGERGIVYLPDYVANGGGLISCAAEWYRADKAQIEKDVYNIHDTCLAILSEADATGTTTAATADRIAERRVADAKTAA